VVNGKIYAIGGWDGDRTRSIVEEYDPSTDRWTRKADMPTRRAYVSASAVNGKIYVIGGWTRPHGWLSTVEEYDTGFVPAGVEISSWGYLKSLFEMK
jgi:hypothetical protein